MISEIKKLSQSYMEYKRKKTEHALLFKNFTSDFEKYNSIASQHQKASKEFLYPCLFDKTQQTNIEPIYFYQDAWAFERIVSERPSNHIDIGSHHKFVALLSKITNLSMVDLRPLSLEMNSINFIKGDILNLPFENESIDSLSSLCVIEHIGLGRYGDTLDPGGSEKAFNEIARILKIGSNFYMSVPVEEVNKVYFNAHRAFNEDFLLNELLRNYQVFDRKYIYGNQFLSEKKNGWGVGCYHLRKIR
ncbi:MAG: DUF268 domain-containing protein [Bacteroidota bacterium]|nr:DUF268 domain-containing protein [Bacteroidota bacterium]